MSILLVSRSGIVEYQSLKAARLGLWMDPDAYSLVVFGPVFAGSATALSREVVDEEDQHRRGRPWI